LISSMANRVASMTGFSLIAIVPVRECNTPTLIGGPAATAGPVPELASGSFEPRPCQAARPPTSRIAAAAVPTIQRRRDGRCGLAAGRIEIVCEPRTIVGLDGLPPADRAVPATT